jgi:hypothetical protein
MLPAAVILMRALFRKSQARVMGQFGPSEALSFRDRPGAQRRSHSGLAITNSPKPTVIAPLTSCRRQCEGSMTSFMPGKTVNGDMDGG